MKRKIGNVAIEFREKKKMIREKKIGKFSFSAYQTKATVKNEGS